MRAKEVLEAVIDAALQARNPHSPGSMGLARGRMDFGLSVKDPSNIIQGATDALAHELRMKVNVEQALFHVAAEFYMEPQELDHHFRKRFGDSPAVYNRYKLRNQKERSAQV
jgi:hypothetical protein